jgi:cysteine-rich repeat protein
MDKKILFSLFLFIIILSMVVFAENHEQGVSDEDEDGVPDEQDNCPNSQSRSVDSQGCTCTQRGDCGDGSYTISGIVFIDNNANGVFDSGDNPYTGSKVYLRNTFDTVDIQSPANTDSQGLYSFSQVPEGIVRVRHNIPNGYARTTDDSIELQVDGNIVFNFGIGDPQAVNTDCGDDTQDAGEECDDGNNLNGDGCDSNCVVEYCGDQKCNDEEDSNSCPGDCPILTVCGDDTQDAGEECDDGNNLNGDGCDSNCVVEYCGDQKCNDGEDSNSCPGDCPILTVCGDGTQDSGEECDDGNNLNGDGCDSNCVVEYCGDNKCNNGEDSSSCVQDCPLPPVCGDGNTDVGEQCDDGNTNNGDGCDSNCVVEYCGDNRCNNGEDSSSCVQDCPLPTEGFRFSTWTCQDGFSGGQGSSSSCRAVNEYYVLAQNSCLSNCNTVNCRIEEFSVANLCMGNVGCAQQGGDICDSTEICPGTNLTATDVDDRCCSQQCVTPAFNLCSECGGGLFDFNLCDHTECNSITEGCYYVDKLIGGDCRGCAEAACENYAAQDTCVEDHCGHTNCNWQNDACVTVVPPPTCAQQGGNTCTESETCGVAFVQASDTVRCCPQACDVIVTQNSISLEGPGNVNVGDQFTVNIMANGLNNLAVIQIDVNYNPNILTYVNTAEGTFLSQGGAGTLFLDTIDTSQSGMIKGISSARIGGGASGDGVIASIDFSAAVSGNSDITFGNTIIADPSGNPVTDLAFDTSVTIN